jgi:hypothetical protein
MRIFGFFRRNKQKKGQPTAGSRSKPKSASGPTSDHINATFRANVAIRNLESIKPSEINSVPLAGHTKIQAGWVLSFMHEGSHSVAIVHELRVGKQAHITMQQKEGSQTLERLNEPIEVPLKDLLKAHKNNPADISLVTGIVASQ